MADLPSLIDFNKPIEAYLPDGTTYPARPVFRMGTFADVFIDAKHRLSRNAFQHQPCSWFFAADGSWSGVTSETIRVRNLPEEA